GIFEKETGAPCLFLQGPAGDLSPERSGTDTAKTYGERVARETLAMLPGIKCQSTTKPLPAAEEDFRFKPRINLSNPLVTATLGSRFFPALIAFYEREYRDGVRPHLTTAVLDGRIGFVGVSGEFFCAHSLRLKAR